MGFTELDVLKYLNNKLHDAQLLALKMCENNSCSACEDGDGCEEYQERVEEILRKWQDG